MDVVFAASAFRHGFAGQDFYELLAGRYLKIRSQRGLEDVYELLGRNLNEDYLHIVYRVLPNARLRVFHISRMSETQKRRYQRYQR